MKNHQLIILILAFAGFCLAPNQTCAQAPPAEKELKADKIWSVEYIRTKPGKSEEYVKYLGKFYYKTMEAAKAKGIISDFILLEGTPSNDEDWDIMILIGVNKYADMDGMDEKFDALTAELYEQSREDFMKKDEVVSRFELREFKGGKMARQLIMK